MEKATKTRAAAKRKAYNVKWQNKYSGEEGYVGDIIEAEKHFVNTFEKKEAEKFKTSVDAAKAVESLIAMGEGDNNLFSIEVA